MWNRRTVLEWNGKLYLIDTAEVPAGMGGEYETMIFAAKKDGSIKSPNELYVRRYDSERSAEVGHEQTVRDAERILADKMGVICH